MQVSVNGEPKDISADATLLALIESLGLNPKTVVVQRNDDIVERADFAATQLQEGDQLELIRFVGGG
jgi:thiamine biosynthesis protein ThiS